MSRDSFEILRIYIPLEEKRWELYSGTFASGFLIGAVNNANSEKEWQKAEELAKDGWELVAAVPLAGSRLSISDTVSTAIPFTLGYILLFKRRIQN